MEANTNKFNEFQNLLKIVKESKSKSFKKVFFI